MFSHKTWKQKNRTKQTIKPMKLTHVASQLCTIIQQQALNKCCANYFQRTEASIKQGRITAAGKITSSFPVRQASDYHQLIIRCAKQTISKLNRKNNDKEKRKCHGTVSKEINGGVKKKLTSPYSRYSSLHV